MCACVRPCVCVRGAGKRVAFKVSGGDMMMHVSLLYAKVLIIAVFFGTQVRVNIPRFAQEINERNKNGCVSLYNCHKY